MADHLAEMVTDFGTRKRSFSLKEWSRFIDIAFVATMELHLVQYEAHLCK